MTREGRAETREAKRTEQTNQESKSGKAAGFSSTSQKGNIVHGKLKSQKELKKITGSEDYKKSDYEGKTKMLNVATANKGMSVKQKKLAAKAPPPNKLDEKDFAVLRAEKAKGRGMGLQDEKVKPGKVMKANLGILAMKKAKDKGAKGAEFLSPIAMAKRMFNKKSGGVIKAKRGVFSSGKISDMSFDEKMKRVESGQINKKTGKFTSMNAMRDAKGFQKGESAAEFNKRRMKLAGAKKALSATRIGKMLLPVAAAGVAAQQYLKSKMKKKDEPKKKMGGGMMQKPMGYSTGRSISTRGGGVDSSIIGKIRDAGPFKRIPLGKSRMTDEDRKKIRQLMEKRSSRKKGLETAKRVASTVASVASPVTAAASAAYKLANKMKDKDRLTDRDIDKAKSLVGTSGSKNRPIKKDHSSRNPNPKTPKMMGGGMMKPMGYSKGVMVKARGCKLGRTKPTKIT